MRISTPSNDIILAIRTIINMDSFIAFALRKSNHATCDFISRAQLYYDVNIFSVTFDIYKKIINVNL